MKKNLVLILILLIILTIIFLWIRRTTCVLPEDYRYYFGYVGAGDHEYSPTCREEKQGYLKWKEYMTKEFDSNLYSNDEFGFSIEYPSDLRQRLGSNYTVGDSVADFAIAFRDPYGNYINEIDVFDDPDFDSLIEKYFYYDKEEIEISGKRAFVGEAPIYIHEFAMSHWDDYNKTFTYWIDAGDYALRIVFPGVITDGTKDYYKNDIDINSLRFE